MIGKLENARFRGERTEWWRSPLAGKPLLFLFHGPDDSPGSWLEQAAYFKERFEIVCPVTRRASLDSNLLDALAILKAVADDGRPVFAVGHGSGAELAANLVPLLAGRSRGLVVMNALPKERPSCRIECPVLVLWGKQNETPPPSLDAIGPLSPKLETRIVEGGHWLHREAADRVNKLLEDFFHE